MQKSAASPSPNFHSEKNYVKKNGSVHFLAICSNSTFKIKNFALEVVGLGILGAGFWCQGSH